MAKLRALGKIKQIQIVDMKHCRASMIGHRYCGETKRKSLVDKYCSWIDPSLEMIEGAIVCSPIKVPTFRFDVGTRPFPESLCDYPGRIPILLEVKDLTIDVSEILAWAEYPNGSPLMSEYYVLEILKAFTHLKRFEIQVKNFKNTTGIPPLDLGLLHFLSGIEIPPLESMTIMDLYIEYAELAVFIERHPLLKYVNMHRCKLENPPPEFKVSITDTTKGLFQSSLGVVGSYSRLEFLHLDYYGHD